MKVVGFLLVIVGAIYLLLAFSEFSRYSDLTSQGNPFTGMVANSAVYLAGVAVVAILAGVGFLQADSKTRKDG